MSDDTEDFNAAAPPRNTGKDGREMMRVDLDGYEGPLDMLLALARDQKVDIVRISILQLAEQYLEFIRSAQNLQIDLAADYLVMAAWLAYLKSRLLLPDAPDDGEEPTAKELEALLVHRLRRLNAMRTAGEALMARPQLGQDVFARGQPEPIRTLRNITYDADLFDLLKAYARRRNVEAPRQVTIRKRAVWSIKQARQRLEQLLGTSLSWAPLDHFIAEYALSGEERRTALASSFVASLEMAREGELDLRQTDAFGPLLVRKK